jgi:hypothetical protein
MGESILVYSRLVLVVRSCGRRLPYLRLRRGDLGDGGVVEPLRGVDLGLRAHALGHELARALEALLGREQVGLGARHVGLRAGDLGLRRVDLRAEELGSISASRSPFFTLLLKST